MKKLLLLILFIGCAFGVNAQNTIKFLGIPVDGSKREVIAELEQKGFRYDPYGDHLEGEFNGARVMILVQTINNIVWRIVVMDALPTYEANIKVRFNNLFDQFCNNGKYTCTYGQKLSDRDNISYEMLFNDKRYEAHFGLVDKSINGRVWYQIGEIYGDYCIAIYYENWNNAARGDDL